MVESLHLGRVWLAGLTSFAYSASIARMLSGGCEALRRFPTDALMDTEWCEGMPDTRHATGKPGMLDCDDMFRVRGVTVGEIPVHQPAQINLR